MGRSPEHQRKLALAHFLCHRDWLPEDTKAEQSSLLGVQSG